MVDTVGSNPITGDRLVTKPSEKYTSNYDQIFRKEKTMEEITAEIVEPAVKVLKNIIEENEK